MKITGKGLIPLPVSFIAVFLENEDILQEINKHFEYNIGC